MEVIDVDPASGSYYEPVNLADEHLLAQDGLPPSALNPQFHQPGGPRTPCQPETPRAKPRMEDNPRGLLSRSPCFGARLAFLISAALCALFSTRQQ